MQPIAQNTGDRAQLAKLEGHERLIERLDASTPLSAADKRAIGSLSFLGKRFLTPQDIVREGDKLSHSCLVVEGLVHRYKLLPNGRRQIVSLHVPGDMPDLQSMHFDRVDHSLGATAPSEVVFIPHAELHALAQKSQTVALALWREGLVDASIVREWVANIGGRPAARRIAHLFCELFVRLRAAQLVDQNSFVVPLTQSDIGDAAGLSTVHVNRTIQRLRALRLITFRDRRLQILDWARLRQEALFDPAYLHLSEP